MLKNRESFLKFFFALLLMAVLWAVHSFTLFRFGDTDRFYHLALSKILALNGSFSLESLPQVDDLGWKNYFPDRKSTRLNPVTATSRMTSSA